LMMVSTVITSSTVDERLHLIEDEVIRDRISRCNVLLTKHFGKGWPDHINIDILNINDCSVCIIGQLTGCTNYREWVDECHKLGIYPHLARDYGLDVSTVDWYEATFNNMQERLEEGWRKVLA